MTYDMWHDLRSSIGQSKPRNKFKSHCFYRQGYRKYTMSSTYLLVIILLLKPYNCVKRAIKYYVPRKGERQMEMETN